MTTVGSKTVRGSQKTSMELHYTSGWTEKTRLTIAGQLDGGPAATHAQTWGRCDVFRTLNTALSGPCT